MIYRLEDLIDLQLCQTFLDRMNELFSFPSSIVDNEGTILTSTARQDICKIYHRMNPVTDEICRRSRISHSELHHESDPEFTLRCPNGLMEVLIPIIIEGNHMGNFISGQFTMESPDTTHFGQQADKYGFDKNSYLEALARVPVWTREKLELYIPMVKSFTEILASTGMRNLQERKAREKVERSEGLFRVLTESMKDVVWILDTETQYFRYVSPSVEQLRGYTVEEVMSRPVSEAFLTGDFPLIAEGLRLRLTDFHNRIITDETYFTDEIRQPRKDGTWVMTEVVTNYYLNSETGHIELRGVTRDITPRKKVEQQLNAMVERYNLALRASRFGIWDWDIVNDRIVWDDRMFEIYSMVNSGPVISYKKWIKLVHPQDVERTERESKYALDGKGDYDSEFRVIMDDGTTRYIKALGQVLHDPSGKAVRMTGINIDITEQKLAEEARKQSEMLFSKAFQFSPIAISISSTVDQKFLNVNETFLKDTGFLRQEIIGKTARELGLFADYRDRTRFVEKVEREGYVYAEECPLRNKSGEIISCLVSMTNVTLGGKPFLFSTIIDISDRKRAEEALVVAKEKAEESDKLKTAFLANMSHEIRTPMNGILGFAELLKEEGLGRDDRQKFISIITKNSNHLLTVINDIIDVAKIDSNQISISKVTFNLNQMMDRLFVTFDNERNRLGKNKIVLKLEKGLEEEQSYILSDDVRLQQVMNNLLGNSLKFTKEGQIRFGYQLNDGDLEFYVSDTGKGIAKGKLEIIFERFRQEDETHTRDFGGTGLGLSISKGLVELLDGKMWVESVEGEGATFYFSLPAGIITTGFSSQKQVRNENRTFDFQNRNILVADDVKENFELISMMLKGTNANLLYVPDGKAALDACLNDHMIDLVLMDIRMPVMNGIEATKEIRKYRTDLPVIALTAYAFTEDRLRCMEAGCTDFLTKPVDKTNLLETIHLHLA